MRKFGLFLSHGRKEDHEVTEETELNVGKTGKNDIFSFILTCTYQFSIESECKMSLRRKGRQMRHKERH